MINVIKQRFMILFLFCLLIIITITPIALLGFSNSRMIDHPAIVDLPEESLMSKEQAAPKSYDTLARIQSTQKSIVEKSSFIVNWSSEAMSEAQQDKLILTLEEQLLILHDLNALPELTFSEEYRADIAKKSYMDMQNPNDPINILRINVEYSDLIVSVYMDKETSVLYEVSVYFKNQSNDTLSGLSEEGFLKYLQPDSGSIERDGEIFSTKGYYTSTTVKMIVMSIHQDTQAVTSYGFEDNSDFIRVKENIENIPDLPEE